MKIAIISDIHEDVVSLQLALKKIIKTGCDKIVCPGDISGFSMAHYNYHHHRNGHECMKKPNYSPCFPKEIWIFQATYLHIR